MKPAHLADIGEVRTLFAERQGKAAACRATVNAWLGRRKLAAHGPGDRKRLFDRAAVLAALDADFPPVPKFISVREAFELAGRPYPHRRGRLEETAP